MGCVCGLEICVVSQRDVLEFNFWTLERPLSVPVIRYNDPLTWRIRIAMTIPVFPSSAGGTEWVLFSDGSEKMSTQPSLVPGTATRRDPEVESSVVLEG